MSLLGRHTCRSKSAHTMTHPRTRILLRGRLLSEPTFTLPAHFITRSSPVSCPVQKIYTRQSVSFQHRLFSSYGYQFRGVSPPAEVQKPDTKPEVVTRFAPSPTGFLHLGSIRTALYNYLHARHNKGRFLLRIEDTDQKRLVPGAVEHIQKTLQWLNLNYDDIFIQSTRRELYADVAQQMESKGQAYKCFCTKERLQQFRHTKYDRKCMHLTKEEQQTLIEQGNPYTIRLILPREGTLNIHDDVYGKLHFDYDQYDDPIIMKSDGLPTYHLANVVDDHDMGVTHCIRGMEWLSSLPKHVQIYENMNWKPPVWMHLPLLYTDEGVKLSKRHGHSNVEWYKERGYLPDALLNFLLFHGWMHHGTAGKEILNLSEIIDLFEAKHLKNKSKMLNVPTLDDINSQHIQKLIEANVDDVAKFVLPQLEKKLGDAVSLDLDYVKRVLMVSKDRIHVLDKFAERFDYFFQEKIHPSKEFVQKLDNLVPHNAQEKILRHHIAQFEELLRENASSSETIDQNEIQAIINHSKKELKMNFKHIMTTLRFYTSGSEVGPYVKDTIATLGLEKTIQRLKDGLEHLEHQ